MISHSIIDLAAAIRRFDWNDDRAERNLIIYGIDFRDVPRLFEKPMIVIRRSDRKREIRLVVAGRLNDREVIAVCALRTNRCRLIAARKATRNEREKYHSRLPW